MRPSLAAAVLLAASPVFACQSDTRPPEGAVTDAAGYAALVSAAKANIQASRDEMFALLGAGPNAGRLREEQLKARPVRVEQVSFMCGNTRLSCGHYVNSGSFFNVGDARTPDTAIQVGGTEMHFLLEHSQAAPALVERMSKLLAVPAASAAPAGSASPETVAAPPAIPELRAPVVAWE
ncbi:MAG: hypothetical protein HY553_11870 [Elusimicrobia bacterium]|nr:hypothetical protein [Elusimicrobiota bacterium]